MGWTNKSTIDLIELYKNKKVLWDPRDDEYYNKVSKNEAWEFIARALDTTLEDCKRKMISLLASLRREKMKIRKCQLAGKIRYRSSWFAFDSLSWLLDRELPNKHTGKHSNIPKTNISGLIKEVRGEDIDLSNALTLMNEESLSNFKTISRISSKKKRKCNDTKETNENQSNEDQTITVDYSIEEECLAFGNFIASKLKNYSSRTRSSVQHAFSNILFSADQGKMENYNPNNYTFAEDLDSLTDSGSPNFYSVLLNTANHEIKQELSLSPYGSPTPID